MQRKKPRLTLPPRHTLNIEQVKKTKEEIDLLLDKEQWAAVRFRDESKIEVQLHTRDYACRQRWQTK